LGVAQAASPVSIAQTFPDTIALPDGFRPEGLAAGPRNMLYSGSVATGAIYAADARTGQGKILVPAQSGRVAIGLAYDKRTDYLYVAGGPTGSLFVYNAKTGANVQTVQLTTESATFINDPVVTRTAIYLTDSSRPVLYKVSLSAGGNLPNPATVQEIPLGGDFEFIEGEFNANGIEETNNGKWLLVVNTTTGLLYRVDPSSGQAAEIDLDGDTLPNADGILLRGKTLYVVQNFINQVSTVRLNTKFLSGEIQDVITDSRFDIPTSIDHHGGNVYVVNARFTTPPAPDTEYTIVKLSR
jgi:hypothetical protein